MANREFLIKEAEDSNLLYYEEYRDNKTEEPEVLPSPEKEKFKIIGKATPRIDGRKIISGRAPFTHDIKLRGMLVAKMC